MPVEVIQINYCSNCKKLDVCKYATLVTQFDNSVKVFNTTNTPLPIRLSVSSINYNCRHKDPI